MSRRIVYTRPGGGVSIYQPSPEVMEALCNGGGWPWIGLNHLNSRIDAEIAAGRSSRLAMRFVHGVAFGGHTEAEAYEIMRDRDCAPYGTAHELIDLRDLPRDRWFRNAWRRSPNGGPIGIDMRTARAIQLRKIQSAARKRGAELKLSLWRERIRRASHPEQLRCVWPFEIAVT